jgi:hypothetical protein
MGNQTQLVACRKLKLDTQSLIERFSTLARIAQDRIVHQMSSGEAPDLLIVDDIRSAIGDSNSILSEAVEWELADHGVLKLSELLVRLNRFMDGESWRAIQEEFYPDAERILRIVHTSGQTPEFLHELRNRASHFRDELSCDGPSTDLSREEWRVNVQPFRDLWVLLNDPDCLSDQQAEDALTRLEKEFGRSLISAITLRRLAVQPSVVADPDRSDARSAEGTDLARPHRDKPPEPDLIQGQPLPDDQSVGVREAASSEDASCDPSLGTENDKQEVIPVSRVISETPAISLVTFTSSEVPPFTPDRIVEIPTSDEITPASPRTLQEVTQDVDTVIDDARYSAVRCLVWQMVASDRLGLAYHLALSVESLAPPNQLEPSALFLAAVLGPAVRSSSGEVIDCLRKSVEKVQAWLPRWQGTGEHALAAGLVVFGFSLRPTLLAPSAGALSLLKGITTIDPHLPALGEMRRSVIEFGGLNLELGPGILKGVRDHAVWQQQLDDNRVEARGWLESNRQASIIYSPTTEVWHRWLQRDRPIGRALEIIVNQQVDQAQDVRHAVRYWSDKKNVEKELARTDEEIRKNLARRRPIEARARTAICSRIHEFVQVAQRWMDLLDTEPRSLDDFRQQRADRCRTLVQRLLPSALADLAGLDRTPNGSVVLKGAVRFVQTALEDISQLFDPNIQEDSDVPSVRVLLGKELLALADVPIDENWHPINVEADWLLRRLESASEESYDSTVAFAKQSEARNHVGTQRVIEALAERSDGCELAERLRTEREGAVDLCRRALHSKLERTRQFTEQAVCYDLITDEERSRFLGAVEECRLLLDEVLDFAFEDRKLEEIDRAIAEKRHQRIRAVHQKLSETTVPADRQADLDIVRQALERGDFLSADEYIELIRKGQNLVRAAEPTRIVLTEFFPTFVQRFHSFMEGDGRSRPETREMVDRIRECHGVGPIDMTGVPGPQATEAAKMVTAWLRLKSRPTNAVNDLNTLLTAFGFRNVQVSFTESPKTPHWLASCQCTPLGDPNVCIIPHFGSQANGRFRILGLFDRPDEDTIVNLVREAAGADPVLVLYFGRMTEQRRRDLAELCWQRRRSFLTIDDSLIFFLCGERFSRLPILFQCALPFTVAEPYTTTASLVPVEMFFGREQERRAILDP